MTLTLKILGAALTTAGLMSTAQAALAVIDFSEPNISVGAIIFRQYESFGLEFTGNNVVQCVITANSDPSCGVRPNRTFVTPIRSSPNFLMNVDTASGFGINVLSGFSLTSLTLEVATGTSSFFVKLFDATGTELMGGLAFPTGTNFNWGLLPPTPLAGISSAVRRIEFSGPSDVLFAIDHLSFNYIADGANIVPEPAGLGLVALALAGVGFSRRRTS